MAITQGAARQGRGNRGSADLSLIAGGLVELGPCPSKILGRAPLKSTREAWGRLARTPHLAQVLAEGLDEQVVIRWAELLEIRARALNAYAKRPLIEQPATGNIRPNPAWGIAAEAAKELLALEDRLGGSPLARMRLGVVVADAANGLGALSALMQQGDDEGAGGPDLRAVVK